MGERLDTFMKAAVQADRSLWHLEITPRFVFGPDFINPESKIWFDLTTTAAWQNHVDKYQSFGAGISIFWK